MGNILYKNLILLFKWWWRFSKSDYTLWKRILLSMHNIKGLKASSNAFSSIREGIWHQLMSNVPSTSNVRAIVEEGMLQKVGRGNSILFFA